MKFIVRVLIVPTCHDMQLKIMCERVCVEIEYWYHKKIEVNVFRSRERHLRDSVALVSPRGLPNIYLPLCVQMHKVKNTDSFCRIHVRYRTEFAFRIAHHKLDSVGPKE